MLRSAVFWDITHRRG